MSTLTLIIVIAFVLGYACIALESILKVNKAAIALFMMVVCWTLFMFSPESYISGVGADGIANAVGDILQKHLGDTSTTLFFLMGAMTIVVVVDQNGGFNFVRTALRTTSKRKLLWRIALMTFLISAVLDNLTTSIVMIMVLRKLVSKPADRMIYAGLVVIAANAGGAFSPIGDVTTIMLWNQGLITSQGIIMGVLLPSLLALAVPAFLLQFSLKGELETVADTNEDTTKQELTKPEQKVVFFLGVGGLIFVPIFRYLTGLPPYIGVLLVLSLVWLVTEIFYAHLREEPSGEGWHNRVSTLLAHIDMTTILFFLGVLMAVGCLEEIGVLNAMGNWLNTASGGNHYMVTGVIGGLSSIIDNVPLVAGCMGMYPLAAVGDMATDGIFWQLLGYCAGTGGSLLIIGSAAGVVVMGMERISFGWYLRHISWVALLGYLAGILCYWLEHLFV